MTSKTTRFDAAGYLDTEGRRVAYMTAARETGDAEFVRDALALVTRARTSGLTHTPRHTVKGRGSKRRRDA